jgi:hypothetical protein
MQAQRSLKAEAAGVTVIRQGSHGSHQGQHKPQMQQCRAGEAWELHWSALLREPCLGGAQVAPDEAEGGGGIWQACACPCVVRVFCTRRRKHPHLAPLS